MQNLKLLFAILFLSAITLLCSCNEEDDDPPLRENYMTAKVGDQQFTASNVSALRNTDTEGIEAVTIMGFNDDENITLGIANLNSTGRYPIIDDEDQENTAVGVYSISSTSYPANYTGAIDITYIGIEKVEGSFTFEGQNVLEEKLLITEGEFSAGFIN